MRQSCTYISIASTMAAKIFVCRSMAGYGHLLYDSTNRDTEGGFRISAQWISYFWGQMNWVLRASTTASQKAPPNFEECKDLCTYRLAYVVVTFDVPPGLALSTDETGTNVLSVSKLRRAPQGTDEVKTIGAEDKRQFTVVLSVRYVAMYILYVY